ncbi:MAG TPA: dethiobiotin synthase [Gammaproteobacteria bacterium]|nr:dethiobiotin synthase [Gammaproteobacteria bacterium]
MTSCRGYFITGTDTGVGKTVVTLGLMAYLQALGQTVAGMKPVASGCERSAEGLVNEDALQLQRQSSVALPYALVNPYALEPPIAPHIAAARAGVTISIDTIRSTFDVIAARADCVLVEGVGGWQVPLNSGETLAHLAGALELDVILVVGLRLGCLSHALLTAESIVSSGCSPAGWVANRLPPVADATEENINTLKSRLSFPFLGVVPPLERLQPRRVAGCLSLPF